MSDLLAIARKKLAPTEHEEQCAIIHWCLGVDTRPETKLIFAIPNAGRMGGRRGALWGARLQREGLRPGVPDLCLPVARRGYHGLYLEVKRVGRHKVSGHQAAWEGELTRQGYFVAVRAGATAVIELINWYLTPEGTQPSRITRP